MSFVLQHSKSSPDDAWKFTFAEFWPLYHRVNGTAAKPKRMTGNQFKSLYDEWANGVKDGNA